MHIHAKNLNTEFEEYIIILCDHIERYTCAIFDNVHDFEYIIYIVMSFLFYFIYLM